MIANHVKAVPGAASFAFFFSAKGACLDVPPSPVPRPVQMCPSASPRFFVPSRIRRWIRFWLAH